MTTARFYTPVGAQLIRTNCIECCAGNEAEVRRCGMHWCPFWPYRMGSNTFHRQELTEAERQERATRAAQLRQGRQARPTRELLVQKAERRRRPPE